MNSEQQPRSSPYTFDVYACPSCDKTFTVAAYRLITMDVPCPQCGKRQVSEYELLKAKHD